MSKMAEIDMVVREIVAKWLVGTVVKSVTVGTFAVDPENGDNRTVVLLISQDMTVAIVQYVPDGTSNELVRDVAARMAAECKAFTVTDGERGRAVLTRI